jgi:succinoglycan biosynthesis transport protein ExoP
MCQVLEQFLAENETKIQELNKKEYQLKIFEREVAVNRQLYDLFLTRFKETDASQDIQALQSPVGRLVQQALVSSTPYKPKKTLIVGISLVLSFLFLTLLVFLYEHLDDGLTSGEDVEEKLALPLLGSLPKVKTNPKAPFLVRWMFLNEPKSLFAESVRSLRTGIMLSALDTEQKILVVTSSVANEGKTTVAINQAFALGQMEKTCLIECDMRRPSIAKLYGLSDQAPGLSELVAGTRQLEECIYQMGEECGVNTIPCGIRPSNPLELLASKRFKEVLERLKKDYQSIVIDTPPVMRVSDVLLLAKYASNVLYVVKANETPYQVVREGLKRLRQVDVPVRNIILNQLDTKKPSKYYHKYGYRSGYYERYEY